MTVDKEKKIEIFLYNICFWNQFIKRFIVPFETWTVCPLTLHRNVC
jgi:hypothetical protein